MAAGLPHAAETDPMSQALGYREDASKIDTKKYPGYKYGDVCASCKLFQGKAGEPWGACQVIPGKDVNAKGWCSAMQKKA